MYQNVCLARFGRLKLLCYDLRSTGRCLQQYSLGQCHLGRRQLAGRDPSLAECQDQSSRLASTVPRVRLFACGQALSEEVAFSSRQRTTGSRLHGFPFVHDDHHQGQSLLILFCLFLPFVVLGCFLSQPFRFRSAVSLRAEIQVAFPGLPPLLRVALGSMQSVSALPGLLRARAGFAALLLSFRRRLS